MPVLEVQVRRLDPDVPLPAYAHPGDAGCDLVTTADAEVAPGERAVLRHRPRDRAARGLRRLRPPAVRARRPARRRHRQQPGHGRRRLPRRAAGRRHQPRPARGAAPAPARPDRAAGRAAGRAGRLARDDRRAAGVVARHGRARVDRRVRPAPTASTQQGRGESGVPTPQEGRRRTTSRRVEARRRVEDEAGRATPRPPGRPRRARRARGTSTTLPTDDAVQRLDLGGLRVPVPAGHRGARRRQPRGRGRRRDARARGQLDAGQRLRRAHALRASGTRCAPRSPTSLVGRRRPGRGRRRARTAPSCSPRPGAGRRRARRRASSASTVRAGSCGRCSPVRPRRTARWPRRCEPALRDVVVVRGTRGDGGARPAAAAPAARGRRAGGRRRGAQADASRRRPADEAPDLTMPERGPEITEIR